MKHYPDLSKVDNADHLLFDLGFSYGVLTDVKGLLEQMVATLPSSMLTLHAEELLETIEDLQKGRLQYRNEIYEAAAEAAKRGCSQAP